ncbi:unnamed protein product [Bursaphelenchus xylophilus]|nr:unnamed protein product [Bursaphelenchus xylophilus]CAG9084546.1 unnamed protein product [Bursaphelenchus xylophilus]
MESTKDVADASNVSSVATEVNIVAPAETETDNSIVEGDIKNGNKTPPIATDEGAESKNESVTPSVVDTTENAKNEEEIEINEKIELIADTKKLDDAESKELDDAIKDAAPEEPAVNNENKLSEDPVKPEETKEGDELDDDEVKTNPAYIPKGGLFYMHDTRSSGENEQTTGDNTKKTRADGKWTHDLYNEKRQTPKSSRELENVYGFDIRSDEKSQTPGASQSVRKDPPSKKEADGVPRSKPGQFKRQSIARREEKGPERQTRPRGPRTFKRSALQNRKSHGEGNPDCGHDTIGKQFSRLTVTNSVTKDIDDGETNGLNRNYHQPDIRKRSLRHAPAPALPVGLVPVSVTLAGPSLGHAPAVQNSFNARPRQPTDAVYFDPKTHVQRPPPQPRERRRLQFVPPQ